MVKTVTVFKLWMDKSGGYKMNNKLTKEELIDYLLKVGEKELKKIKV